MEMSAQAFYALQTQHLQKNQASQALIIADHTFTGDLDITHSQAAAGLHFRNCNFRGKLFVEQNNGNNEIRFENCVFEEDVRFGPLRSQLSWGQCQMKKDLVIDGCIFPLKLTGFAIEGELRIAGGYPLLELGGINSKRMGRLSLQAVVSGDLLIYNCRFEQVEVKQSTYVTGIMTISQVESNLLKCQHLRIGNWLVIENCIFEEASLDNLVGDHRYVKIKKESRIQKLKIAVHQLEKLEIDTCKMQNLCFWGDLAKTTHLEVWETECNELEFNEVYNEGRTSFRGVTVPQGGRLIFRNCTMGRSDFIRCDFSNATLEFEDSKVTEIFVSETDFPQKVTRRGESSPKQAQLIFGQLRTAFDKQGDLARSLEYQAREIEAHFQDIKSYWRRRFPWLHFTKLALGLNKLSNDFGRDWGRGIVFSFGVGIICFYLLVISSTEYSFGWGLAINARMIAAFAHFMNPLRFFETEAVFRMNGKDAFLTLTAGSYLIDFIGRIFVIYGYYQTIQSFRRFGRK